MTVAAVAMILAQVEEMARAIGWSLVLIALLVVGFFGVMRLRQWLKEEQEEGGEKPISTGFTLSDLRQLHRQGQLSDEEFERARSKMVAAGKLLAEKLPDPLAGSRRRAAGGGGQTHDDATGGGQAD